MEKPKKINIKVLYVEDDTFTNEVVSTMLRRRIETLLVAENGRDGLKLYMEERPDLIITDSTMPFMTGIEMVEAIRKESKEVIIYMVTAHEEKEFLEKAEAIGVDGCIIKPVDKDKLQAVLERVSNKLGRG